MKQTEILPAPISAKVKADTAELHKQTEAVELSARMVSDKLTPEEYIGYLRRLHSLHAAFEKNALDRLEPIFSDIHKRKKSQLLLNDIGEEDTISPAQLTHLETASLPYLAGYFYVLEGSVLGGRFLLKNAEKVLGEAITGRTSYFSVYGDEIGRLWKQFISELDQYGTTLSDEQSEEVIQGATQAFNDVAVALQMHI